VKHQWTKYAEDNNATLRQIFMLISPALSELVILLPY